MKLGGFSGIQSVSGGTGNDLFSLNGGVITQGIAGGGGNDTLAANLIGDNTWTVLAANGGQVLNAGLKQSFSDIQNLWSNPNSNNAFIFNDGAQLSGRINGGSLDHTNTLVLTKYLTPLIIRLSSTNSGSVEGMLPVTGFDNITDVNMNIGMNNSIYLPAGKTNFVAMNGAGIGSINDPINFSGVYNFFGTGGDIAQFTGNASLSSTNGNQSTILFNGVAINFFDFGSFEGLNTPTTTTVPNVANIIIQPDSGSNGTTTIKPSYVIAGQSVGQNISDMIDNIAKEYDANLKNIKINPYCYAAN